jgi:hypothetical protein
MIARLKCWFLTGHSWLEVERWDVGLWKHFVWQCRNCGAHKTLCR